MGMFDSAPTAPAKVKKTKAQERQELHVDDFCVFAAAKAVSKALEGWMKPLEARLKEACTKLAIDISHGKKPESFNVLDGLGSGQFQLRKRGSNMPLAPDAIAKLTAFGIPLETVEVKPELFYINPALLADPAKRAAIEVALTAEPALAGDTIVIRQAPVSVTIVGKTSIEMAFGLAAPLETALCLDMLTIPAFKTGFDGTPAEAITFMERAGFSFEDDEEEEAPAA